MSVSGQALRRRALARTAVLGLALLLAGCTAGSASTSVQPEADARLAVRVKAALLEAGEVDAAAIRISARGGVVRLDGFVASGDERQRALRTARTVDGVLRAVDGLTVRSR